MDDMDLYIIKQDWRKVLILDWFVGWTTTAATGRGDKQRQRFPGSTGEDGNPTSGQREESWTARGSTAKGVCWSAHFKYQDEPNLIGYMTQDRNERTAAIDIISEVDLRKLRAQLVNIVKFIFLFYLGMCI